MNWAPMPHQITTLYTVLSITTLYSIQTHKRQLLATAVGKKRIQATAKYRLPAHLIIVN